MNSTKDILAQRSPQSTEQLTTGSNLVRTTVNCQLSEEQIDRVLDEHLDLVTTEFRGWHRSHIKRLGVPRYKGLAFDARRGKSPRKLFSYLLRRA